MRAVQSSRKRSSDRAATVSPSNAAVRTLALGAFAFEASLLASDETLRSLAYELDARLLLEDVRRRVPTPVRGQLKRVLFRATPKRVVEAVVVELTEPGQFGALVRHLVPAASEGKTTAELAWVEGSKDDVVAAVPAPLFEAAVRALARG